MAASSELCACQGPAVLQCHGGAETGQLASLLLADCATNDLTCLRDSDIYPMKDTSLWFLQSGILRLLRTKALFFKGNFRSVSLMMQIGSFRMSNVPMVPGKGIGTFEEQEMPPCIFQHLRILGEEGLLAEFALKAHVKLKDITCLLPNTQMGWACFSPCIWLVGHLALKPHKSVSGISPTLEKHPMIKASVEEEFGFFLDTAGYL